MARPRKTPATVPPVEEAPREGEPVTPIRRRRRRRTVAGTSDNYSETATLISAVLRSRGTPGATPDVLQHVVTWANSIREEGEELRTLGGRSKRQKALIPSDRVARHEMNRALLDGVLGGTITLVVEDDGKLLFVHSGASTNTEPPAASGAVIPPVEPAVEETSAENQEV